MWLSQLTEGKTKGRIWFVSIFQIIPDGVRSGLISTLIIYANDNINLFHLIVPQVVCGLLNLDRFQLRFLNAGGSRSDNFMTEFRSAIHIEC